MPTAPSRPLNDLPADSLVLAGDIGGSNSRLGLFRGSSAWPEVVVEQSYSNRAYTGLGDVIRHFFTDTELVADRACFGVAGAVLAGTSQLPNLGWQLSETGLAEQLGFKTVRLINDLEANARGIATLSAEQFFSLNAGRQSGGNRALIAAGTGLGMALLAADGDAEQIVASEGGHADFAPRNEEEVGLWRFLAGRYGRVSIERVVSGPGLSNIYDHLRQTGLTEPAGLSARLNDAPDRAAVIAQAGLSFDVPICMRALELFLSAYGAAAGNLALTALATGGLYIGGGIAPKLLPIFPASGFMAAFIDKGRFADLLADIPVRIILEPKTALRGAASMALAS